MSLAARLDIFKTVIWALYPKPAEGKAPPYGCGAEGIICPGFGEVNCKPVKCDPFIVENKGKPLSEVPLKATRAAEYLDDPELAEWAARVNGYKAFLKDDAKTFRGAFANQNKVCKLRHPETVDFLVKAFDVQEL